MQIPFWGYATGRLPGEWRGDSQGGQPGAESLSSEEGETDDPLMPQPDAAIPCLQTAIPVSNRSSGGGTQMSLLYARPRLPISAGGTDPFLGSWTRPPRSPAVG
jgi:hypothetical protein